MAPSSLQYFKGTEMIKTLSCVALLLGVLHSSNAQCTVTKAYGTYAPTGDFCAGDLIFDEEFETFDLKKWEHEKTLGGGGVSILVRVYCSILILSVGRTGSSNGTPTADTTVSLTMVLCSLSLHSLPMS